MIHSQFSARGVLKLLPKLVVLIAFVVLVAFALVPFAWMVLSSFKPTQEFFRFPIQYLPESWTLEHFQRVLSDSWFVRSLMNSLMVGTVTVGLTLLLAIPASYGFAKFKFVGRQPLLIAILGAQFVPPVVFLVPLFMMMSKLKMLNSLKSVFLVYPAFTVPFCIWMLTGFLSSIPNEVEEAAQVDGCSRLQVLTKVVIPLSIPGIASAGLYAFIWAWQEYLIAMVFLGKRVVHTAPLALTFFMGEMTVDWSGLMTASTLLSLPVIPALFLAKYYQQGLAATGSKG